MTRLDTAAYLHHLRTDSARFAEVLAASDPGAPVPACPEWTADDLLWHLAEVQTFWSRVIRERPAPPRDDAPDRPADRAELLAFFEAASTDLTDALAAADPVEQAWSWAPEQTVGFTVRRQAHEALIHRLDAEQTAGAVSPLDPALAADGVAELVDIMYGGAPPTWARFEPGTGQVTIELVDTGHVLRVRPGLLFGTDPDSGESVDGPHLLRDPDGTDDPDQVGGSEPSATVSGTAADLDAWLWKRGDDSRLTWSGDAGARGQFLAAVRPPLD